MQTAPLPSGVTTSCPPPRRVPCPCPPKADAGAWPFPALQTLSSTNSFTRQTSRGTQCPPPPSPSGPPEKTASALSCNPAAGKSSPFALKRTSPTTATTPATRRSHGAGKPGVELLTGQKGL